MDLSVLIPVYNYDCHELLARLHQERATLPFSVEVLLGDDASTPPYKALYQEWEEQYECRVYHSESNRGAGAMRNLLGEYAQGEQLLILDSDILPLFPDFLARYIQHASPYQVVCGGFRYPDSPPSADRLLRYKYGHRVESQSAEERQEHPYGSFISMSFMIPRTLFVEEGFNTRLGMGYEDALFGERLGQRGIAIEHIENPVLHILKESSAQFLQTTQRYLRNLYYHRELFGPSVRLLSLYRRLSQWQLTPILSLLAPCLLPLLERQLLSRCPSLRLFALYKLLYFSSLQKP